MIFVLNVFFEIILSNINMDFFSTNAFRNIFLKNQEETQNKYFNVS